MYPVPWKLTAFFAPKNGGLKIRTSFSRGLPFSGAFAVSCREDTRQNKTNKINIWITGLPWHVDGPMEYIETTAQYTKFWFSPCHVVFLISIIYKCICVNINWSHSACFTETKTRVSCYIWWHCRAQWLQAKHIEMSGCYLSFSQWEGWRTPQLEVSWVAKKVVLVFKPFFRWGFWGVRVIYPRGKFNMAPKNGGFQKGSLLSQGLIFRWTDPPCLSWWT